MFSAIDKFTTEALSDARVLEKADRKFSAMASGTLLFSGHICLVSGGLLLTGAALAAALGSKDAAKELAIAGGSYLVGTGICYTGNKLIRVATVDNAKKVLAEREPKRTVAYKVAAEIMQENTEGWENRLGRVLSLPGQDILSRANEWHNKQQEGKTAELPAQAVAAAS